MQWMGFPVLSLKRCSDPPGSSRRALVVFVGSFVVDSMFFSAGVQSQNTTTVKTVNPHTDLQKKLTLLEFAGSSGPQKLYELV